MGRYVEVYGKEIRIILRSPHRHHHHPHHNHHEILSERIRKRDQWTFEKCRQGTRVQPAGRAGGFSIFEEKDG